MFKKQNLKLLDKWDKSIFVAWGREGILKWNAESINHEGQDIHLPIWKLKTSLLKENIYKIKSSYILGEHISPLYN